MEEYFKARQEFIKQKSLLNNRLKNILTKNGFYTDRAWFNWNKEDVIIVWDNCKFPRDMFYELEKEFGRIECVYTTKISNTLFIKFEKEQFR